MWWQLNKGFALKEENFETRPTSLYLGLCTWRDIWQEWNEISWNPLWGSFSSSVCKILFFFHIKKYVLFPHKGKGLCNHLSPWLTWFELKYSRLIQLFPGTENISQLIRNWHLLSVTKKSNWSENTLLRKQIVPHHILLFHFYVGWIKRKTKTLWFTYIHANTFLILYIKYLCIFNCALLRKMSWNSS